MSVGRFPDETQIECRNNFKKHSLGVQLMLMVYMLFIKEISYCDDVNFKKMTNIFILHTFLMF
jgi:hypothetical protein